MIAMSATLISAAIAVGRMPGEPPTILRPSHRFALIARLAGLHTRRPLADPRLEVLRAISASIARGAAAIRDDLLLAAFRAGWSRDDLRRAFPAVALDRHVIDGDA